MHYLLNGHSLVLDVARCNGWAAARRAPQHAIAGKGGSELICCLMLRGRSRHG
jgi:hypothetical protein